MTDIDFKGQTLTALRVEYTAGLSFTGGYFVLISSPFTLDIRGRTARLTPDGDRPEAFEPMQALVGRTVSESSVGGTGTLSIAFDDGSRVLVEPDSDYEAWNASGPNGLLVVCMPGGELTVFRGNPPK
jgi:uncharacterized protein DUF6188